MMVLSSCGGTFELDENSIANILPPIESKNVDVMFDDTEEFYATVKDYTDDQYKNYVEECKNIGFTTDIESDSYSFDAYNSDGYRLNLIYFEDSGLDIDLEAPKDFSKIEWPKSDIAKLLPVPKSDYGIIEWENSDGFVMYIANTTVDDYKDYVDECMDKGFDVDYDKGDDYFFAQNKDNYQLHLSFEGNGTMFISIDAPLKEEEENTETDNESSKDKEENKVKTNKEDNTSKATKKNTSDKNKDTEDEILNVSNCSELASILSLKDEFDPSISSFATKYKGREIEFDANVASVMNHEGYSTRFDYLIYAGDYSTTSVSGPCFQLEDVNYYDLNLEGDNIPDSFTAGLNMHIVAEIEGFNASNGLFKLDPVKITMR